MKLERETTLTQFAKCSRRKKHLFVLKELPALAAICFMNRNNSNKFRFPDSSGTKIKDQTKIWILSTHLVTENVYITEWEFTCKILYKLLCEFYSIFARGHKVVTLYKTMG